MYKKRITALVCLLALLLTMPVKAYAFDLKVNNAPRVPESRMTYIAGADCTLSIQGGIADVDAYVVGNGTTKCEIIVELQEKSFLSWDPVASWSDAQNGRRAAVNESVKVTVGKSYRTVTTVTVWSGTESESKTLTSGTYRA